MGNKTKLFVTVRKNDSKNRTADIIGLSISAYSVDRWTEYDTEKECYVAKQKKTAVHDSPIGMTENGYTDLFVAVLDKYVPQMVYTCLNTINAKSPNEKIRKLMNECIAYAKSTDSVIEEFESSISDNIVGYMPDSATAADILKELEYAEGHVLQYAKLHTYTMQKGEDGKLHKVEIVPYETNENTRFGMVRNRDINIAPGLDCEDLMQTAKMAMIELAKVGLVRNVSDFWNYSGYVYKAVNTDIQDEKKRAIRQDSLIEIDEDGEEKTVTIASVDRRLAKIEKQAVFAKMIDVITANCDKRSDSSKVVATFKLLYIDGHTQAKVAEKLGVKQQQIARYAKTIQKLLASPETYTALHDCIGA